MRPLFFAQLLGSRTVWPTSGAFLKLKLEIELENPSPKVSACPYVRTRAGSLVPRLSLFVSSFRRQTTQLGQSLELRKLTILEVLAGLGLITVLKSSSIRILYYSNARQRHF